MYEHFGATGGPDRLGFALGGTAGDDLRLGVVGYQFPDASEPAKRYSWYLVCGSASALGRSWDFQSPALTCDDAPLISEWFRRLAAWGSEPDGAPAPSAPWLIEPNLQFRAVSKRGGLVRMAVELDLEFLPLERRSGARAGRPESLTLLVTPDDLVKAADDFDATIEIFPRG